MYSLNRPLISPATGLPKFSTPPDNPLDYKPEEWIARNKGRIRAYDLIHHLGSNAWVLLQAAFESEQAIAALSEFTPADSNPLPKSGLTIQKWLIELHHVIVRFYPGDVRLNGLSLAIEEFFGPFKHLIQNGASVRSALNPTHFAALFSYYNYIEYDDKVGCFYIYEEKQGIWRPVSEEWVLSKLVEFYAAFATSEPTVFHQSMRSYGQILGVIKATNIRKHISLPDKEVICLQDKCWMVSADNPTKEIITPHSPYFGLRNVIPVKLPTKISRKQGVIRAKRFDEFLRSMMDVDDVDLLQFWCGMVLLGKNPFHKILLLSGAAGAGKSTLLNILECIIGSDNVASFVTGRLQDRFELSGFFGKTLLAGKDVADDFLSSKSAFMLKSLSGDSNIKAEVKFVQSRVTLNSPFNIVVTSNAELMVDLQGDVDAWSRRLWVIPIAMDKTVKRKPNYEKELLDNESSEIFGWMATGAIRVLTAIKKGEGYVLTPRQRANVDLLLNRSNPVEQFVRTCLQGEKDEFVSSFDLYDAYFRFCPKIGVDPIDVSIFQRRIGAYLARIHNADGPQNSKIKPIAKGYYHIKLAGSLVA